VTAPEHKFHVEDIILSSRQQVDDLEAKNGVDTTPQVFIGGERVGRCDVLEQYLARD
jgi:glutaredoxin 3